MIKNEVLPPDTMSFDGSLERLDMRRGLGSSWCFDSLEAQACRPYNLGYFGEGATKKNQVLPPDTGKGVLKESGPAKTLFFSSIVLIL